MNESLKYKRGTIWWFHDKDSIDSEDHVQRGNRPVLVVSNDEGNSTNPTLVCLAITTKVEKKKTINVIIKNDKDENNTVLCNQFKTVNKSQLTKYLYTLSDKDMKRVEEGMIIALQLNYLIDALLCTYSVDQLNSIIEGIIVKKVEQIKSESTKNIMSASEVYSKIDGLISSLTSTSSPNQSIQSTETNIPKLPHRVWTESVMRSYLEDVDTLSKEEMVVKYQLKKNSDVSKYKTYCKKRLNVK